MRKLKNVRNENVRTSIRGEEVLWGKLETILGEVMPMANAIHALLLQICFLSTLEILDITLHR